jgi:D-alanyl-D-alanine carboxypeptidase
MVPVRRVGALVGLAVLAPVSAAQSSPPRFAHSVSAVTRAELGRSYHAGCPVGPAELRLVRLRYWGFDQRAHNGSLVVNRSVVPAVVSVFARLYSERFPIRRIQPIAAFNGSDPASMAVDNTSAFNCRYAVAPGPKRWSVHAFGEAIDVNTVENPYVEGGIVRPRAGRQYLDRSRARPGMAVPGGALVRAFAAVRWQWGGRWAGTPDYQHFSSTGG